MKAVIGLVIVLLAAVVAPRLLPLEDHNFSQYPGFAEYFAAHPPSEVLPTAADIDLLRRFRPRFFLPKGHEGLISFYDDYIARGVLRDGKGRVISDRVTTEILNAHKDDPGVVFSRVDGPAGPFTAVVFGRIDDVAADFGSIRERLRFLTYTTVHGSSGLPNGLNELRFLAPSDAFCTFKGFLGERRAFPGRDGSPGADYNAPPHMKPLDRQLVYGYCREGNEGDLERFRRTMGSGIESPAFAEAQHVFRANLQCAGGCDSL